MATTEDLAAVDALDALGDSLNTYLSTFLPLVDAAEAALLTASESRHAIGDHGPVEPLEIRQARVRNAAALALAEPMKQIGDGHRILEVVNIPR